MSQPQTSCPSPRHRVPLELYVHHAAGSDGAGSSSYVDHYILRDRDDLATETQAMEERLYVCQNMRYDVVAMIDEAGHQVAQARYSTYGVPFGLPAGDCDADGDVDSADWSIAYAWYSGSIYDPRADMDLDGSIDIFDLIDIGDMSGSVAGRGVLSTEETNLRFGYAGYHWDGVVDKYHVRNRVYDPYLGRWITRDPAGYVDEMSMYLYASASPQMVRDPMGLDPFEDIVNDQALYDARVLAMVNDGSLDPMAASQLINTYSGAAQASIHATKARIGVAKQIVGFKAVANAASDTAVGFATLAKPAARSTRSRTSIERLGTTRRV